jgi:trk system potassium uptake protein TrkH
VIASPPKQRGATGWFLIGLLLSGFGGLLALFAVAAWWVEEPSGGFLWGALLGIGVGVPLQFWARAGDPRRRRDEPSRREALIALVGGWCVVVGLGSLPYVGAGALGWLDALFESMSGFTTTGATTLRDFSAVGPVLFMWRALTQWLGGIGIIVLFVGLFPYLAIAGRDLFFAEAPGPTEERLTPRLRHTAVALLSVYSGLSVTAAIAYGLAGMNPYDAIAHALTSLSAGGFSPYARSFEGLAPTLVWLGALFMLLAGSNFALLYRTLLGRTWRALRDPELRAYLMVATLLGVGTVSTLRLEGWAWEAALRDGIFQTLAILTSTGYASADFAGWSPQAQTWLLFAAFIGASAGSAAGGVKLVRWLVLKEHVRRQVRGVLHPHAVLPLHLGGRVVPERIVHAVMAFIILYALLFVAGAGVLVLLGTDPVSAFSATIACLGNIGPGIGAVGPMESFAWLHPGAKGVLIFLMLAGRLEVVSLFALASRDAWRAGRARG